jgi:hypothetical protein
VGAASSIRVAYAAALRTRSGFNTCSPARSRAGW